MTTTATTTNQKYIDACNNGDISIVEDMIRDDNVKQSNKFLNYCLKKACEGGHIDIVKIILEHREDADDIINYNYNYENGRFIIPFAYVLYYAFKGGCIDVINLISEKTRQIIYTECMWKCGLYGACVSNNTAIFEMYLKNITHFSPIDTNENKFFNNCLEYACQSDNFDMINYLADKGATDWNKGLLSASRNRRMEVVELMAEKGATDWNFSGMYGACLGGDIEIVKYVLKKITSHRPCHLMAACEGGNMEIIDLLVAEGNTYWNDGLEGACRGACRDVWKNTDTWDCDSEDNEDNEDSENTRGYGEKDKVKIAEYMIQKGATNLNERLYEACLYGKVDIAKLLLRHGAKSSYKCLYSACQTGDLDLVKQLVFNPIIFDRNFDYPGLVLKELVRTWENVEDAEDIEDDIKDDRDIIAKFMLVNNIRNPVQYYSN